MFGPIHDIGHQQDARPDRQDGSSSASGLDVSSQGGGHSSGSDSRYGADSADVRPTSRADGKSLVSAQMSGASGPSSGASGASISSVNLAGIKGGPLGWRSTTSAKARASVALRASIIDAAYDLALKSETPWKNLIAVAMEQYRRGEKRDAREVLQMAKKMAADPDDQLASSIAVREVIKAMLSQRQAADAMEALHDIQNPRQRERALGEVAAWSARLGKVDMARTLIVQIINGSDRDVALIAIAESEASYEGASVAMQTASTIINGRRKDDAYRRVALKRGTLKDFSGAEQSVQMMKNENLKDLTLAALARLRAQSGDVAGGLQMVQNVRDQSIVDSSLREMVTELAALGQFSESAYITTRIHDDRERSYALEQLSVEQARTGDLSGSLVRTDSIPIDAIRERTLGYVSRVTADGGSPARARNVAIRINSIRARDRAYRSIAQAAAADGDHAAAYNTLQEINRSDEKAMALVSMARARQRQGDSRQALLMLEDAGREIQSLQSVGAVGRIQAGMAVAYAERQESGHSLLIADSIRNLRQRDATYGSLARTFARYDIQAAQQSVLSISSDRIRLRAEDTVARTLAQKITPQNAVYEARSLYSERQQIVFLLEVSRKT